MTIGDKDSSSPTLTVDWLEQARLDLLYLTLALDFYAHEIKAPLQCLYENTYLMVESESYAICFCQWTYGRLR